MTGSIDKRSYLAKGRDAFTLAELLVTIGIIALLAAILLPVMNAAFRKADKARARSEMSSIVTAIKGYYNEYGKWPSLGNGNQDATYHDQSQAAKQQEVMFILRAIDNATYNSGNENNRRAITFLEVSRDSMEGTDRNSFTYSVSDGYFLDPWGNPYVICMDLDGDSEIGISGLDSPAQGYLESVAGTPSPTAVFPGITVGVMSYGADPGDTNEFLTSWFD